MFDLNLRDSRPIYEQLKDRLRQLIISGGIREGEQLPSVREMAAQLAINPNTIQRAYRELEVQGWIASVPGKGSFICGIPAVPTAEQRALLEQFDKTAAALLRLGLTRDALVARLEKGE
jgi:GntR family transcriptional regulator